MSLRAYFCYRCDRWQPAFIEDFTTVNGVEYLLPRCPDCNDRMAPETVETATHPVIRTSVIDALDIAKGCVRREEYEQAAGALHRALFHLKGRPR